MPEINWFLNFVPRYKQREFAVRFRFQIFLLNRCCLETVFLQMRNLAFQFLIIHFHNSFQETCLHKNSIFYTCIVRHSLNPQYVRGKNFSQKNKTSVRNNKSDWLKRSSPSCRATALLLAVNFNHA